MLSLFFFIFFFILSFYLYFFFFFFFNDTATTEIYTLSLHDALRSLGTGRANPSWPAHPRRGRRLFRSGRPASRLHWRRRGDRGLGCGWPARTPPLPGLPNADRAEL